MKALIRKYGLRIPSTAVAAAVVWGMAVGGAHAYMSVAGSGSAGAGVSSLTAPGNPSASAGATDVSVTWRASAIGAGVPASDYTVERYSGAGADLGEASCGPVPSSAGLPDAFGSFSCTDSPPIGTFKYRITAHYRSWTASSGFTNSVSVKGSQSIEFEDLPASQRLDQGPITVKAKASSGLPVTYESRTTSVCATSGGSGEKVSFLTTGTCTIRATQAGDEEWAAANEEQSFAITPTASLTALSPASVEAGEDTTRVVVSPDGKSVYATNGGDATISQYSRNAETGKLTALSPATVPAGAAPEDVVVSPDGANVYVANRGSNTVSQYSRSLATGVLTAMAPIAAGEGPIGLTSSPDGRSVYATNSTSETVSQYSRNPETGKLAALSPATVAAAANAHAVVVSPDGTSAYVANYGSGTVGQYSRNIETGKLSVLSPATVTAGINPHGIAISPGGESVYVANNSSSGTVTLLTRSTATGKLTTSTAFPAGAYSECVVVSPDGAYAYATNEISSDVSQYSRNAETGRLTTLSPATIATGIAPSGIAISTDGKSVYTANSGSNSVSQYGRTP